MNFLVMIKKMSQLFFSWDFLFYLCQMKKLLFKYFDTFCYGELIEDENNSDWVKPFNKNDTFGYSVNKNYLFYNGGLLDDIERMFGVRKPDFKEYFGDWFRDRYNLEVLMIL